MNIIKHFYSYILSGYSDNSLVILMKARIILTINLILISTSIFIVILMLFFFKSFDIMILLSLVIGIVFYFFSISLLRLKKFKIASHLNIIYSLIAFYLSTISQTNDTLFLICNYTVLSFFLLIESSLISYTIAQPFYVILISFIALITIPLIKVTAGNESENAQKNFIAAIISCGFFYLCSGILVIVLLRMTNTLTAIAASESEKNKVRYHQLEGVVLSFREGQEIGENLIGSAEMTMQNIGTIRKNLDIINTQMDGLKNKISDSIQSHQKITQATGGVRNRIIEQNSTVSDASANIEEITASIQSISKLSSDKQIIIADLMRMADTIEEKISSAVEAIQNLLSSSKNLHEINEVIVNISGMTNILAMNAAIEAAHAGEYGKGFSVVADEIKKLAEETAINTAIIKNTLSTNINDIRITSDSFGVVSGKFQEIFHKINEVHHAITEIITGMSEMSNGTGQIISAVSEISNIGKQTQTAALEVETVIKENSITVRSVEEAANFVIESVGGIIKYFETIINETNKITQIGFKNKDQISKLAAEIETIKSI